MQRGWKIVAVLVMLIIMGFCAGCMDQSYDRSDNGTVVPVKTGNTVRISLAENPSTGFSWNATTTGDLSVSHTGYTTGDPVGAIMGMVGGGGARTWDLVIGEEKVQTFSAAYRRPWEPANRTLGVYEITFTVV
jgi:predicted secreted protein